MTEPTSYATWSLFKSDPPATNAVRFATYAEAFAYGNELLSRWMVPIGFDVRPSDDAVNYTADLVTGVARPLEVSNG